MKKPNNSYVFSVGEAIERLRKQLERLLRPPRLAPVPVPAGERRYRARYYGTIAALAAFGSVSMAFSPVQAAGSTSLRNSTAGTILLDVQRNGEAWYVNPQTTKRHYLGRPADAFRIMRELGLGITNAKLATIPPAPGHSAAVAGIQIDENATSTAELFDSDLTNNLSGRILLQVEANGEAWYVNPKDKRRYYLGRPADAFAVMRATGLGITKKDLALVPKDVLDESIDEYSSYTYTTRTSVEGKEFKADILEIDLDDPTLEIITDTADDTTCTSNCKAKSLADFVEDNGGFAGIPGSYFCPADYGSCSSRSNTYFNPVYNTRAGTLINANQLKWWTTGPLLVFDSENRYYYFKDTHKDFISEAHFKATHGVDIHAAMGNQPRLIQDGLNYVIEWELDEKQKTAVAPRAALAVKGRTLYAVIVYNATIPELASVLRNMEVDYAINLDGGYTTALYYNGVYKEGPRRDFPNAVIFRKK